MPFQNPTGDWEYEGTYTVELTPDADMSIAPPDADIFEFKVTIHHGSLHTVLDAMQFFGGPGETYPFHWSIRRIKCIRNAQGKLLWLNSYYQNKIFC